MGFLRDLRDVFGNTRHRKAAKVKYCPRCASEGVHISSSLGFWLAPKKYVCDKCGYVGPVFMELEKVKDAANDDARGESS